MAHESFEDEAVAAYLNENFVAVKVDREERPDVDAVYMAATQALTGQGGWPMTVFTTPSGQPFYAGTYFPPRPAHGLPSFPQLLQAISDAWQGDRSQVTAAAGRITAALQSRQFPGAGDVLDPELVRTALAAAVDELAGGYDDRHGGFGTAPKFPPSMVLELLLRQHALTGDERALAMVAGTGAAMARGGIYDQLAGGFARYSVDAAWVVPHFEKMLYDNALLLRAYLHWWRVSADPLAERVVRETAAFLLRDLGTPEGGFASALDADTEGVEGSTYVWTPAELVELLGQSDGEWAGELLEVTAAGTFEHGASVLTLRHDPDDARRWAGLRARLLAARGVRPQPARDDKVVTAWNALAIEALAEAGALLGEPDWVAAAVRCADLLVSVHLDERGRLRRVSRDGAAGEPAGVLEDYAATAAAFLTLHQVSGGAEWLELAGQLLDVVLRHFSDGTGGFFDTPDDGESLVSRPQDPTDNATPAGWSLAAGALLSYAALTGSDGHRTAAEAALAPLVRSLPARFAGESLAVAAAWLDGPREVAIVGPDDDEGRAALRAAALRSSAPGRVVSVGEPGADGVPLLEGRVLVGGRAAAYVCRRFVCDTPVTGPDAVAGLLVRGLGRPM
jgi:uncharacterized protein YyaL (SSP411 family)